MQRGTLGAAALALGLVLAPAAARSVELVNNGTNGLNLDLGASFSDTGELENTTNTNNAIPYKATAAGAATVPEYHRDNTRVYLFQTEDRLTLNGGLDGVGFHMEEALGGESVSTSNNQANLYQMWADVPLGTDTGVRAIVGQFKVPSNLESAQDVRSLMFAEQSPLLMTFFNQGYDNGVGLAAKGKLWDATAGTISGSPDIPQRYLPEMFNVPPMLYLRAGVGNIADDPYQQKQTVTNLDATQWGVHVNGEYISDSNAGHSDQLALQNSDATTVSSDNVYGNVLVWSNWNPFLGKTSSGVGTSPVHANYWNSSVDGQLRVPLSSGLTFIGQAQWDFAEFNNTDMLKTNAANEYLSEATINLSGGELVAGLANDTWGLAGRFDMVLPSQYLMYNSSDAAVSTNGGKTYTNLPTYQPNSIVGSKPIMELTFPALTYRVNKYARITAESLFWFNSPEISGDDGVYELLEMPTQVTNLFPGNGTHTNPLVLAGRMAFVLAF